MIAIRQAGSEDVQEIAEVLRRSITELCALDHRGDTNTLEKWLANKRPQDVLEWLADSDLFCVIAEAQDRIAGVGLLHRSGELRLCYVAPGAQRKGVGKGLYTALEERARAWKLNSLRLESTLGARPFYEALGFKPTGCAKLRFGISQCHPYEKALNA